MPSSGTPGPLSTCRTDLVPPHDLCSQAGAVGLPITWPESVSWPCCWGLVSKEKWHGKSLYLNSISLWSSCIYKNKHQHLWTKISSSSGFLIFFRGESGSLCEILVKHLKTWLLQWQQKGGAECVCVGEKLEGGRLCGASRAHLVLTRPVWDHLLSFLGGKENEAELGGRVH